jgi:hypothetical protein
VVEEHESIIFEGLEASSEHGLQISLERERERERGIILVRSLLSKQFFLSI